jgi:hypothetical protein
MKFLRINRVAAFCHIENYPLLFLNEYTISAAAKNANSYMKLYQHSVYRREM